MSETLSVPLTLQSRKTVGVTEEEEVFSEQDFTVVSYNILADFYLQSDLAKGQRHQLCPKECVTPKDNKDCRRHKLLYAELQWLNGDIVCFQEVDSVYFEDILKGDMFMLGYDGMFAQKASCTGRQEGVALFYKQVMFDLEDAQKLVINEIASDVVTQGKPNDFGEVLIVAALRHKTSGVVLVVGNTHILWGDLMKPVTQACEIALVTQALYDTVTSFKSQGNQVAYVLCGDFNVDPGYPSYELLKQGKLNDEEFCKLQTVDYLRFPKDVEKPKQVSPEQISLLNSLRKNLHNPLTYLRSAYGIVMGSEPECTGYEHDGSQVWTLDYIWFDSENLKATAALETLPKSAVAAYGGFPNQYFPSDHISVKAHFKLLK